MENNELNNSKNYIQNYVKFEDERPSSNSELSDISNLNNVSISRFFTNDFKIKNEYPQQESDDLKNSDEKYLVCKIERVDYDDIKQENENASQEFNYLSNIRNEKEEKLLSHKHNRRIILYKKISSNRPKAEICRKKIRKKIINRENNIQKLLDKLKLQKLLTIKYLDSYKDNFINYIENQKNTLLKNLKSIEELIKYSKEYNGEIEVNLERFKTNLNSAMKDLKILNK
jgi:hypothetical protein